MDQRTPSFEALSPRFRGFDAYFDAEIAPHAPALIPRAGERRRMSWGLRLLVAAAAFYLATAPFALIVFPLETADFRPWAIVSYFIILPGVLFGVLSPREAETQLSIAADAWTTARRRIAAFFGFEHAPPPKPEALSQFVEICPAPALGGQFLARERIIGRIRKGVVGKTPVAMCAMRFGGKAFGVGALLDDRVQGMDRRGLEGMEVPLPTSYRNLTGFAENQDVADRLTSDATLLAFAEIREETASRAINLSVVDDAARMYFALTEPVFAVGDQTPDAMSVGHALHDYDALVRMAEALTPMFRHA
ncbi:MAG: hypothetical protein ACKVH0_02630 [Alphaproteobacteria bacterium]